MMELVRRMLIPADVRSVHSRDTLRSSGLLPQEQSEYDSEDDKVNEECQQLADSSRKRCIVNHRSAPTRHRKPRMAQAHLCQARATRLENVDSASDVQIISSPRPIACQL